MKINFDICHLWSLSISNKFCLKCWLDFNLFYYFEKKNSDAVSNKKTLAVFLLAFDKV